MSASSLSSTASTTPSMDSAPGNGLALSSVMPLKGRRARVQAVPTLERKPKTATNLCSPTRRLAAVDRADTGPVQVQRRRVGCFQLRRDRRRSRGRVLRPGTGQRRTEHQVLRRGPDVQRDSAVVEGRGGHRAEQAGVRVGSAGQGRGERHRAGGRHGRRGVGSRPGRGELRRIDTADPGRIHGRRRGGSDVSRDGQLRGCGPDRCLEAQRERGGLGPNRAPASRLGARSSTTRAPTSSRRRTGRRRCPTSATPCRSS